MAIDDTVTQFDPNPSDVVDRVNNPDVLTADQYQNRLVDFYRQTLGSTGIQTTKPDEDEDEKKPEPKDKKKVPEKGGKPEISKIENMNTKEALEALLDALDEANKPKVIYKESFNAVFSIELVCLASFNLAVLSNI